MQQWLVHIRIPKHKSQRVTITYRRDYHIQVLWPIILIFESSSIGPPLHRKSKASMSQSNPQSSSSESSSSQTSSSSSSSQASAINTSIIISDDEREEALTKCLLSQYRYCAGGVVTGATYTVIKRSTVKPGPWPMLAGGFVGTLGDFVYGYFVDCAHLRQSDKIFEVKDNISGGENEKWIIFSGWLWFRWMI